MPSTFTYPGVYVEEIPSGVHPIAGVSTADTAFVDFFPRGPERKATAVRSLAEFDRVFGGLDPRSEASYAVYQFFLNGGSTAWILRVTATKKGASPPARASAKFADSSSTDVLTISAANEGAWGNALQVAIDNGKADTFDLVVREVTPASGPTYTVLRYEVFRNLVVVASSPQYVETVINAGSSLITAKATEPAAPTEPTIPAPSDKSVADVTITEVISASDIGAFIPLAGGEDGLAPAEEEGTFAAAITNALTPLIQVAPYKIDLLCIPVAAILGEESWATISKAAASICDANRIFYIADVPKGTDTEEAAVKLIEKSPLADKNTALYFPRLSMPDPLAGNLPREIGASGAVAGIYARTDTQRGVWKAPAGTEASLRGATLRTQLNDNEDGALNVIGVNTLRTFPVNGTVVWGSRTTVGADAQASEWKYVPVRRTALYIEESLAQGLRWAVFEPNDETLWRQIRTNVWAFMNDLFRQGAFAGATPAEAFLVKCDKDTTIQSDIDRGIVNIVVGFQPLQPAEFVVLQIQQLAGQSA